MQKKLIALAIAAAASGAAFAQTNVTIYGIADVGYVGIDADDSRFQHNINSGVLSTSRIGFKGAEDLGNGLKAIFTLEYGLAMDSDTGIGATGARGRQQFVGLTGGFGTVVAGRLQTAGLDYTVAGSALGGSAAVGAINQVADNGDFPLLNSGSRANNAVAYISPSFGGVTVALNHSRLTESAADDDIKDNTATLIAVNYDGGPLTAGFVYGKVDVEKTPATQWTLNPTTGLTPPAAAAKAKNADATEWGIRAGYDFGVAKLQAAYQRAKLEQVGGDLKNNRWILSATVPVTAKIGVIGEYAHAKIDQGAGVSDDKNKAYTLAATYSLSKRTTAYAAFVAVRPDAKDSDVNIYGAGLRHAF